MLYGAAYEDLGMGFGFSNGCSLAMAMPSLWKSMLIALHILVKMTLIWYAKSLVISPLI